MTAQLSIHQTAQGGNATSLRRLLKAKPHLANRRTSRGWTALHYAAFANRPAAARALLEAGADLNARNRSGLTPLHVAVAAGQIAITRQLLQWGADLSARDNFGYTPFHTVAALPCGRGWAPQPILWKGRFSSALRKRLAIIDLLLAGDADMHLRATGDLSILHLACATGSAALIRRLLTAGLSANVWDARGNCPLHIAALGGHYQAVRCLLENGAGVNLRNTSGSTPLHLAAGGYLAADENPIVESLPPFVGQGAYVGHCRGCEHERIVQLLLAAGAHSHQCDGEGHVPLYHAALHGEEAIAGILLSASRGEREERAAVGALHDLVEAGNEPAVTLLVDLGVDVNALDGDRATPLQRAIVNDDSGLAHLLLEFGADVFHADALGRTALHEAVEQADRGVIRHLLREGACPHVPDRRGVTPFYIALRKNYYNVMGWLEPHPGSMHITSRCPHRRCCSQPHRWRDEEFFGDDESRDDLLEEMILEDVMDKSSEAEEETDRALQEKRDLLRAPAPFEEDDALVEEQLLFEDELIVR